MQHQFKSGLKVLLITSVYLLQPALMNAQRDSSGSGWQIGLSTGYFMPSSRSAAFYNGAQGNENTIGYIIKNPYLYNEIFSILEASDTFLLYALPTDMRYTANMMVGFTFRNKYKNDFSWYLSLRQVNLRAADTYTLQVDPLQHIATEPDLRRFMIWGEEQRHHIDFGVTWEFPGKVPQFVPSLDAGVTMTNVKVKEHKIYVEEREYSMINIYGSQQYVPGVNLQVIPVEQGGIGFGAFAGVGGRYTINDYFSLDPSFQVYINTINLEPYNQLSPHFLFNLSFTITNLLMYQNRQL
jgi:hypothetical protein